MDSKRLFSASTDFSQLTFGQKYSVLRGGVNCMLCITKYTTTNTKRILPRILQQIVNVLHLCFAVFKNRTSVECVQKHLQNFDLNNPEANLSINPKKKLRELIVTFKKSTSRHISNMDRKCVDCFIEILISYMLTVPWNKNPLQLKRLKKLKPKFQSLPIPEFEKKDFHDILRPKNDVEEMVICNDFDQVSSLLMECGATATNYNPRLEMFQAFGTVPEARFLARFIGLCEKHSIGPEIFSLVQYHEDDSFEFQILSED